MTETRYGDPISTDTCHCCKRKQPDKTMVLVHFGRTRCEQCIDAGCWDETKCLVSPHY